MRYVFLILVIYQFVLLFISSTNVMQRSALSAVSIKGVQFVVVVFARALDLSEKARREVIHLQLTATSLAPCWSPRERKRSLTAQEHIPPQHRGDKAI